MRGKHLPWIDQNSNRRREREGEQCTHKMQSVSECVYIDTTITTTFEEGSNIRKKCTFHG